ncbi:MAG: hypothetical protein CBC49_000095 [Alphaproteobacteria bacterium TMED89]|nr:MAG: hypothetical protein CBC49_000095 [Alphaproteobacteria bacterium TMED89]
MNPLDSTNSRAKQEPSSDGMFQTLSRYPLITWIMVLTVVLIPFLSLRMFFSICEHLNEACFRETNWKDLGPMGDYIGGIMNPIITAASFLILSCALLVQIGELSEASKSRVELAGATEKQATVEERGQIIGRTMEMAEASPEINLESFLKFCSDGQDDLLGYYQRTSSQRSSLSQQIAHLDKKIRELRVEVETSPGVTKRDLPSGMGQVEKKLQTERDELRQQFRAFSPEFENFESVRGYLCKVGALADAHLIDFELLAGIKPDLFRVTLDAAKIGTENTNIGIPSKFVPPLTELKRLVNQLTRTPN